MNHNLLINVVASKELQVSVRLCQVVVDQLPHFMCNRDETEYVTVAMIRGVADQCKRCRILQVGTP